MAFIQDILHQRQNTLGMFTGTNFEMSTKGANTHSAAEQASVAVSIAKIRMSCRALALAD